MFLVRGFTIVCLIASAVGFGLAAIVENASRPARSWAISGELPCVYENGQRCLPPRK